MPITVPRASITETADDLKVRDRVLRGFPEVEQVVGKGGRAETPTDPSRLDMIETVVNLRPREQWPKRAIRGGDALAQTAAALAPLEERGLRVVLAAGWPTTAASSAEVLVTVLLSRLEAEETQLEALDAELTQLARCCPASTPP